MVGGFQRWRRAVAPSGPGLLSRDGLAFIGHRIRMPAGLARWQMPQGGIASGIRRLEMGQTRAVARVGRSLHAQALGGEVDVGVGASEPHREPFLAIPAITPAHYPFGDLLRHIMMKPATAFGED